MTLNELIQGKDFVASEVVLVSDFEAPEVAIMLSKLDAS